MCPRVGERSIDFSSNVEGLPGKEQVRRGPCLSIRSLDGQDRSRERSSLPGFSFSSCYSDRERLVSSKDEHNLRSATQASIRRNEERGSRDLRRRVTFSSLSARSSDLALLAVLGRGCARRHQRPRRLAGIAPQVPAVYLPLMAPGRRADGTAVLRPADKRLLSVGPPRRCRAPCASSPSA
jgi:hypothetical protein